MKTGDIVRHYKEKRLGILMDITEDGDGLVWFPKISMLLPSEKFIHVDNLETMAEWEDVENFVYA